LLSAARAVARDTQFGAQTITVEFFFEQRPTLGPGRCPFALGQRATSTKAISRNNPTTSFERNRLAALFHVLDPKTPPFLFSSIVGKPGIAKKRPGTLLAVARVSCTERSTSGR
jgi:hypothetical protein